MSIPKSSSLTYPLTCKLLCCSSIFHFSSESAQKAPGAQRVPYYGKCTAAAAGSGSGSIKKRVQAFVFARQPLLAPMRKEEMHLLVWTAEQYMPYLARGCWSVWFGERLTHCDVPLTKEHGVHTCSSHTIALTHPMSKTRKEREFACVVIRDYEECSLC